MNKYINRFFFIFIFLFATHFAQAAIKDTVIIHGDARVDMFVNEEIAVNKRTANMTSGGLYKGYRLQVLSTRSREDAFKLKAWFMQNEPGQKAYLLFQSPYFKVRIGNFLTKSDALDFKKELSRIYAQPVYLVDDAVEYTPPDDLIQ